MLRWGLLVWVCLGALGLGFLAVEASRRKIPVSKLWFLWGLVLGPIFLFFIVPLWLGKWGRRD